LHNVKYNWELIGKRIKKERDNLSLTQEGLSEKLGTSRQLISRWEKAVSPPILEDLLKLSEIFNCELGYILCEYDCKTKEVTEINTVTGLSENAISVLSYMKTTSIAESVSSLNKILESEKFYDLIRTIHLHALNFNHDKINLNQGNISQVADVLGCTQNEVKKYLESTSKSTIESDIMGIVKSINLGYNDSKKSVGKQKTLKQKELF